jgi:hypothetical protein
MKTLGIEVKHGAHIACKLPDGKSFVRLKSMPDGYDEISIRQRISGEVKFTPKPRTTAPSKVPQLLIDIQEKLQQGYGKGYEHWAKVENLERSAKTLIYIQESGIDSYEELERKCSDACGAATAIQSKIRDLENEQNRINELQKYIGQYGKTRAVYKAYNEIKNPKKKAEFYEAHRADVTLHKAAKKHFNERGLKKLPGINQLREQWAELEKQKRSLCSDYKTTNKKFKDLCTAKSNASNMLGLDKTRQTSRDHGAEL